MVRSRRNTHSELYSTVHTSRGHGSRSPAIHRHTHRVLCPTKNGTPAALSSNARPNPLRYYVAVFSLATGRPGPAARYRRGTRQHSTHTNEVHEWRIWTKVHAKNWQQTLNTPGSTRSWCLKWSMTPSRGWNQMRTLCSTKPISAATTCTGILPSWCCAAPSWCWPTSTIPTLKKTPKEPSPT